MLINLPDIPSGHGVPLVDLSTDLFPTPTMDALDARYATGGGGITEYANVAEVDALEDADIGFITLPEVNTLIPIAEAGIGSTVYLTTYMTNGGFGQPFPPAGSFVPLIQEARLYRGESEIRERVYRRSRYWNGSSWNTWGSWSLVGVYAAPGAGQVFSATTTVSSFAADGSTYLCNVACTVQLPTHASDPIPIGRKFHIMRDTAGVVSVAALTGVTLRNPFGVATLRAQYSIATVTKTASNVWVLSGDVG